MTAKVDSVNQIDDDALFELLHEVFHRMRAALQAAIGEDEAGLAGMEARALAFVARHEGTTAGELVKRSGRDKGQVARLVARLTELGLIARTEGDDRRSYTLHLTAEGKAAHRRIERKRNRAAAAMFRSLSAADRASLAGLLRRLVEPATG
jgi:DNA-binding MarR family transcriptional regulator